MWCRKQKHIRFHIILYHRIKNDSNHSKFPVLFIIINKSIILGFIWFITHSAKLFNPHLPCLASTHLHQSAISHQWLLLIIKSRSVCFSCLNFDRYVYQEMKAWYNALIEIICHIRKIKFPYLSPTQNVLPRTRILTSVEIVIKISWFL